MIRVRQVKVLFNETDKLINKIASKLKINVKDIINYKIVKESIDSRYKPDIYYVYEVDVKLKTEKRIKYNKDIFESPKEKYIFIPKGSKKIIGNPIVVGSGPAGLFCAYMLASFGYKPFIIERGENVENRIKSH